RLDHSGAVRAEDDGELDLRVEAGPDVLVAMVQGGGFQPDNRAVGRRSGIRHLLDLELLADLVQADRAHGHLVRPGIHVKRNATSAPATEAKPPGASNGINVRTASPIARRRASRQSAPSAARAAIE